MFKNIKLQIFTWWENNPLQNQQAWKSRNFSSPQITGYIFWGFPNWMVQIIWFSNWKFWFSHWFLIDPAFCEGILKQMKSLDVNQETPQKGNLYSYVYWKSTEKKKDKWHPPFRWCIQIHTYPFTPSAPTPTPHPPPPPPPPPLHALHTRTHPFCSKILQNQNCTLLRGTCLCNYHTRPTLTSLSKPRRSVNANFLFLFPFWIMQRTFSWKSN